jgi:hypothetical protein
MKRKEITEARKDWTRRQLLTKPDLPKDEYYCPPSEGWFNAEVNGVIETWEYLPAPDLESIAQDLIGQYPELAPLNKWSVVYLWKRQGGTSNNMATLGRCIRVSGLTKYFTDTTWVIWLAADHLNLMNFTRLQVEALLHHELLHAGEDEDSNGNAKPTPVAHDFEGFGMNVARYGAWSQSLSLCQRAWKQLALFQSTPIAPNNVDPNTGEIYPENQEG